MSERAIARPSLNELAAIAETAAQPALAADARALSQRLRDGATYIVCLGQFKRGKSTLLNALIGAPVLPVGVTPVTSVITVVRYGERPGVAVQFLSGAVGVVPIEALAYYVTEDGNHENRLAVKSVEVTWPSALLSTGVCLVDTPGIGSVFAGNTQVTLDFVPQVDAALIVVGADPPISRDELSLVRSVSALTPALIVVSNKSDRVGDDELARARAFTETQLAECVGRSVPVWAVSATERVATGAPTRDWPQLDAALADISGNTSELLRHAEARGAQRMASQLRHVLAERLRALEQPIEVSGRRIADLHRGMAEANRLLLEMDVLLGMDIERTVRDFEADQREFLRSHCVAAGQELNRAIESAPGPARRLRGTAFSAAASIAQHRVMSWLRASQPRADRAYHDATKRFADRSTACLTQIHQAHFDMLSDFPHEIIAPEELTARSHFFPTDLMPLTASGPLTALFDNVLPRRAVVARVRRRVSGYLDRVFETNASRAVNDLRERLHESRRAFQGEVRQILQRLIDAAEQAFDAAVAQHEHGADAVAAEIARVSSSLEQLHTWEGGR